MMPTTRPPEIDECQPRDPPPHQPGQDAERSEEKPPAANFLVPLVTTDEDVHRPVIAPETQQCAVQPSSPSPATSSEDEKERDLESARVSFTGHQANHETPVEPVDSIVVDWESPEDPHNPVNWSAGLKWANIAVVSAITFIT